MPRHNISNVNAETRVGDCSVCGPAIRLKPQGQGINAGRFKCYLKYLETKQGGARFSDGTRFSAEEYLAMKNEQNGRCAICTREKPLVVDHCHTKKKVRGLLCRSCNLTLGNVEDNVDFLKGAIKYLEERK